MHVAIVGPGALGRVYGVRLAATVDISFVAHAASLDAVRKAGPMRIERVDADQRKDTLDAPRIVDVVPPDADAVLVCVRAEQLDEALVQELTAKAGVPVVVITPLMPAAFERLRAALGPRALAAMPGVVAYLKDPADSPGHGKVTRYWLPRVAPTLIDEPREADPALSALVEAMTRVGLPTRLELGVHETNPATTVSFIPIAMGLDAAGGADALLADKPLFALALAAAREGSALSARIGRSAAWATMLTRFIGPRMLRIGLGLARRASPEAVWYVEEHFGHKLHDQNVAMAQDMVTLARQKGTPHEALDQLLVRLRATERSPGQATQRSSV